MPTVTVSTLRRASASVAGAIQSRPLQAAVEGLDDVADHRVDVGLGRGAGNGARHRSGRPRRSARCWSPGWRGARAGAAAAGRRGCGRRRRSADRHRPAAARRRSGWRCGRRASPSRPRAARCATRAEMPRTGSACQATIRPAPPSRAASKKASQSMPGARVANSARRQVCTRCGSCAATASAWARAILVSRSKMRCGAGLGVGHAHQRQHLADIGAVAVADPGHRRRVGEIIIAVRQAEAALQQIGHVAVRLLQPLGDEHAEQILGAEAGRVQRIDVGAHAGAERGGERRGGLAIAWIRASMRLQRRGAAARRSRRGRDRRRNNRRSARALLPAAGLPRAGAGDDLDVALLDQQGGGQEGADRWSGRPGSRCGCASRHWHKDRSRRRARRPCRCRRRRRRPRCGPAGWAAAVAAASRAVAARSTKRGMALSGAVVVE